MVVEKSNDLKRGDLCFRFTSSTCIGVSAINDVELALTVVENKVEERMITVQRLVDSIPLWNPRNATIYCGYEGMK